MARRGFVDQTRVCGRSFGKPQIQGPHITSARVDDDLSKLLFGPVSLSAASRKAYGPFIGDLAARRWGGWPFAFHISPSEFVGICEEALPWEPHLGDIIEVAMRSRVVAPPKRFTDALGKWIVVDWTPVDLASFRALDRREAVRWLVATKAALAV